MNPLEDSSDIREACALFERLLAKAKAQPAQGDGQDEPTFEVVALGEEQDAPGAVPAKSGLGPERSEPLLPELGAVSGSTQAERLEALLTALCQCGGISVATLTDSSGLLVATVGQALPPERLAALAAVLGAAGEKVSQILGRPAIDSVRVDLDRETTAVLKRFVADGRRFYLMVLCPRSLDERGLVETGAERLVALLARS